ncbi:hypothetical protein SAMD00019534_003080 [Acytostelium subglobosum LB1]|uniref:hypothetical protein n=1 Tax=Acytostelium subglobosum LB1 TaxID=1410327 RepID=UPI0006452375|nr:hypothetical protein SAMD00019534_003080 [Acytostelium subglobosum LB1]GAM17133.1 hypothetical protein SAMD00019534_003080 [Acytostelium subglobosum LB1]|eukprot:XP_012759195.1 hypothetical protein SAMD00019534_003080 [Acytostelium subglobosum LB1]
MVKHNVHLEVRTDKGKLRVHIKKVRPARLRRDSKGRYIRNKGQKKYINSRKSDLELIKKLIAEARSVGKTVHPVSSGPAISTNEAAYIKSIQDSNYREALLKNAKDLEQQTRAKIDAIQVPAPQLALPAPIVPLAIQGPAPEPIEQDIPQAYVEQQDRANELNRVTHGMVKNIQGALNQRLQEDLQRFELDKQHREQLLQAKEQRRQEKIEYERSMTQHQIDVLNSQKEILARLPIWPGEKQVEVEKEKEDINIGIHLLQAQQEQRELEAQIKIEKDKEAVERINTMEEKSLQRMADVSTPASPLKKNWPAEHKASVGREIDTKKKMTGMDPTTEEFSDLREKLFTEEAKRQTMPTNNKAYDPALAAKYKGKADKALENGDDNRANRYMDMLTAEQRKRPKTTSKIPMRTTTSPIPKVKEEQSSPYASPPLTSTPVMPTTSLKSLKKVPESISPKVAASVQSHLASDKPIANLNYQLIKDMKDTPIDKRGIIMKDILTETEKARMIQALPSLKIVSAAAQPTVLSLLQQYFDGDLGTKQLQQEMTKALKKEKNKFTLHDSIINEAHQLHKKLQIGHGRDDNKGLYDYEIEKLMEPYHKDGFEGVIASDELDTLKPMDRMSFIMNLDKSNQPGSHWVILRPLLSKNGINRANGVLNISILSTALTMMCPLTVGVIRSIE